MCLIAKHALSAPAYKICCPSLLKFSSYVYFVKMIFKVIEKLVINIFIKVDKLKFMDRWIYIFYFLPSSKSKSTKHTAYKSGNSRFKAFIKYFKLHKYAKNNTHSNLKYVYILSVLLSRFFCMNNIPCLVICSGYHNTSNNNNDKRHIHKKLLNVESCWGRSRRRSCCLLLAVTCKWASNNSYQDDYGCDICVPGERQRTAAEKCLSKKSPSTCSNTFTSSAAQLRL